MALRKSDFTRKTVSVLKDAEVDISDRSEEEIQWAEDLRALILKYPVGAGSSNETIGKELITRNLGISFSTFKRKRRTFEEEQTLSCLFSKSSSGGRGKRRIPQQVINLVHEIIERTDGKSGSKHARDSDIVKMARAESYSAGYTVPAPGTVRSIISEYSIHQRAKRKFGSRYAKVEYDAHPGEAPEVFAPLERIQIDHTLVDVIVTDEENRVPLGRPWITAAIDEYTRAVLGFYLSFEHPSATVLAFSMARIVLKKDQWLDNLGLDHTWPMHGIPHTIYVDNGMDFKNSGLISGCREHGINRPEYRPPGEPHYGGIIERFLGTLMGEMRLCSGSTTKEWLGKKVTFDAHETAEMTLRELERYLATFIAGVYHKTQRDILNHQTPEKRWNDYFMGSENGPIRPQPRLPKDPVRFTIDFMASMKRVVKPSKISFQNMSYWDEILREIVHKGDRRYYEFRWNHYDITKLYMRHPVSGKYHIIRNRRGYTLPISLHEWKEVDRYLKERGYEKADEDTRFRALEEMRAVRNKASSEKRRAKRQAVAAKRKSTQENVTTFLPSPSRARSILQNIADDEFVPQRLNIRKR